MLTHIFHSAHRSLPPAPTSAALSARWMAWSPMVLAWTSGPTASTPRSSRLPFRSAAACGGGPNITSIIAPTFASSRVSKDMFLSTLVVRHFRQRSHVLDHFRLLSFALAICIGLWLGPSPSTTLARRPSWLPTLARRPSWLPLLATLATWPTSRRRPSGMRPSVQRRQCY